MAMRCGSIRSSSGCFAACVHRSYLAATWPRFEAVVPAWAAGVPVRIHGEHGRDVGDLDGSSRKYQWVRRLYRPFVTSFIALSRDLEHYLSDIVGIRGDKVVQIYNGVDAQRFTPRAARQPIAGCPFTGRRSGWWVRSVACRRSRTN